MTTLTLHKSRLWYGLPVFLHAVGGLIGYVVVRKSNPALAMRVLWVGILLTVVTAGMGIYFLVSFQIDMAAADARIHDASQIFETASGPIEYADIGNGYPVLVVHGAGGGFDQGILLSQTFFGADSDEFRIIAPSRFGFLHTPKPSGIDTASFASQADAFSDLLDGLDIEKVAVVGFSAGGPSSIEFALRHPENVSHLVLVSAVVHAEPPLQPSDDATLNGLFKSDFAFWFVGKYMESQLLRFLGVTPEVQATLDPEQRSWISSVFIPSMNPISQRQPGMLNDRINFVSIDSPLEDIDAPTLVINAWDDTLVNPSHSAYAKENIRNAQHIQFESGGHVLLGRHSATESAIVKFIAVKDEI